MRHLINTSLAYQGDPATTLQRGLHHVRRILVLSADGQASRDIQWPLRPEVTGIAQVFAAVSGTQIDSYNFETLILADLELDRFVELCFRHRRTTAEIVPRAGKMFKTRSHNIFGVNV